MKVKKRNLLGILALSAFITSFILLPQAFGADKTFNWRMGYLYPRSSHYYQVYHKFCEDIKTMSGGRLVITEVYDGEGVPAPELLGAIRTGLLEMAQPWPPIHSGEVPVGEVEAGLPAGPSDFLGILAMYRESDLQSVLEQAYAKIGITYLGDVFQPSCYALTKEKITSLEDFKGMKLRATGAYGKMMRHLGAVPVTLALGEVYTSMATGVVEGAVGAQILDYYSMKIHEVAKYLFPLPVAGYQAAPFLVNTKAWNKLPDDLKQVVKAAFDSHSFDMPLHCFMHEQAALKDMMNQGLQISPMPTETEKTKWVEAGRKVWPEYAKGDPSSQKAVQAMESFIDKYNVE
jgi:TRAP-type C4-dicarboxylate transport system substrate-binding protein